METSARNQLRGTVKAVSMGAVMALVTVDVDGVEGGDNKGVRGASGACCGQTCDRNHQSDRRDGRHRLKRGSPEGSTSGFGAATSTVRTASKFSPLGVSRQPKVRRRAP
jgi:hypothetical protein